MSVLFPRVTTQNGRRFVARHDLENYKLALAGLPPVERDAKAPIEFVPFRRTAEELGICVRSVERRVAAAASKAA
jgi:hypothetical protein